MESGWIVYGSENRYIFPFTRRFRIKFQNSIVGVSGIARDQVYPGGMTERGLGMLVIMCYSVWTRGLEELKKEKEKIGNRN